MRRPFTVADLHEAQRMRAEGCSWRLIGKTLGRSPKVVKYHLDETAKEKEKAYGRSRKPTKEQRRKKAEWHNLKKSDPLHRANRALYMQRADAKRRGYSEPTWNADVVAAAFDGKCFLCGVPEIECSTRLHVEHDHKTGKFRGWACPRCNMVIGIAENYKDLIDKFTRLTMQPSDGRQVAAQTLKG